MHVELLDGEYWHLVDPDSQLLGNAFLGKGLIASGSVMARSIPGAGSSYGLFNQHTRKERAWEDVRVQNYPQRPSRINALFLFDDRATALGANRDWFGGQRVALKARIVRGSNHFVADARSLDAANESAWITQATHYWAGIETSEPVHEVIVDGWVFFPEWQLPPFGVMRPAGQN